MYGPQKSNTTGRQSTVHNPNQNNEEHSNTIPSYINSAQNHECLSIHLVSLFYNMYSFHNLPQTLEALLLCKLLS